MYGSTGRSALDHLTAERATYAQKWAVGNAARFEADGHYGWMAGLLTGYDRVLEIGTGDGRGTLALRDAGHSVVSIDENPEILAVAKERLAEAGKAVQYEARGKASLSSFRGYEIRYTYPQQLEVPGGALLLEGDIQHDTKLVKWLRAKAPFDAVVCWLIGTHHARTFNAVFDAIDLKSVNEYRLSVQNHVYALAREVLRPGGVLQVVDRGQPLETEQIRANYIYNHKEQASGTPLEFVRLDERYYQDAEGEGVQMIPTVSNGGPVPELPRLSLVSVTSKKQMP